MPLYDSVCLICKKQHEYFRSIAERDQTPACCGTLTKKVLSAASVIPDIQPYQSQITGEMITGRAQHKEHLKRHGCIEVGNDKTHMLKTEKKLNKLELKKAIYQNMQRHR